MNETRRLSLKDASAALGISESGVRARFKTGKLSGERDNQGKIWVFVSADVEPRMQSALRVQTEGAEGVYRELVDTLKQQVAMLIFERDALRGNAAEVIQMTADIARMEAVLAAEKQQRQKADAEVERLSLLLTDRNPAAQTRGAPWWNRIFGKRP